MKGMIDEEGQLYIERAGKMVPQTCKKSGIVAGSVEAYGKCDHKCPHFGEPWGGEIKGIPSNIQLCITVLNFEPGGFEDKRAGA